MTQSSKADRTQDRARGSTSRQARSSAGESERRLRHQAERPTPQRRASEIASLVVAEAKELVKTQVSQRTGRPAQDLSALASALRMTGEQLEGNVFSSYINKAADQL